MAEAVTTHLAAGRLTAASAGSQPVGEVHPLSIKYLAEQGIETRNLRSESSDLYASFEPDVVITLCDSAARESCPVWFSSAATVHWGLADPSLQNKQEKNSRQAFENTIDILRKRITGLLELPFEQLNPQQRIDYLSELAHLS